MSNPRRILDRDGGASPLARDLVTSARDDRPPEGAKARARASLDRVLANEGAATTATALSGSAADEKLVVPSLERVPVASNAATHAPLRRPMPSTRAWLVTGSIASAVIVAGVAGIMTILRPQTLPQAPVVVSQNAAPPPATTNASASAPPAARSNVPTPPATGATPVASNGPNAGSSATGTPPAAGSESGSRERPSGGSRSARERPTGSSVSSSSASTATAASNSAASPSGGSCAQRCRGDIDCLLRCGTQGPAAAANRPPPPSGGGDGPETPSRNDVITAMNGVRSAVAACGQGMTGTAQVSVTFASSGRVTTANVSPPFAGTPTGSCIARAVRSASVPSFTRPTFTVNFPFAIH